jgi:uncharacterized protein
VSGRVRVRVVHLELHTGDLVGADRFYAGLLGWRGEPVRSGAACYHALDMGDGLAGGIVECGARHPLWLPYVQVERVDQVAERARSLGAAVLVEPREGAAGWRSVVSSPQGGEIALWQPKRRPGFRAGRGRVKTSTLVER